MINSIAYYNDFWNEMRGKQAVTHQSSLMMRNGRMPVRK